MQDVVRLSSSSHTDYKRLEELNKQQYQKNPHNNISVDWVLLVTISI